MKVLRQLTQSLSAVYPDGEASAMARWVMDERFGLSLTDLMLDKDNTLSSFQLQELQNITERLLRKEPIQYVLGQTAFCGLTLHVEPGVLIPRPETQELVEWISEAYAPEIRPETRVLDIGTGSGCIALSLASRGFGVAACDVSPEALRIAKDNASRLGLDVDFFQTDILQTSKEEQQSGDFDLIVSNPPYICQQEAVDMEANVLEHEPHLALFVPDDDPLLFYRHIAQFATTHLRRHGALFFEINRAYGEEVCKMLQTRNFDGVQLRNDQFDNPRMVRAFRVE